MIKHFLFSLFCITLVFMLGCGGKDESAEGIKKETIPQEKPEMTAEKQDQSQQSEKPNLSDPKFYATRPGAENKVRRDDLPGRGPDIKPGDLEEGTCAYYAFWFNEYFTSGDSARALALCTDEMAKEVRAFLQAPRRYDFIQHNKDAGYTIESVATVESEDLGDTCLACLTATFMGQTADECSWKFMKIGDEWLLVDWITSTERREMLSK